MTTDRAATPRRPRNVYLVRALTMLALAALCAVGYFVIAGAAKPSRALQTYWPEIDRSLVTGLTLKGPADTLELRKRAGTADVWEVVAGTDLVRADANGVDDLLQALTRQSVRDRIPHENVTEGDLRGYGLDKPTIEIDVVQSTGTQHLRYGKLSHEGTKVYVDGGPGTDVWVVPKDAMELAISAVAGGLKDKRIFASTLYDVGRFEVVREGVTQVEVMFDAQIWRFVQPFKGYANPTKFENGVLGPIVNAEIEKWEEFSAPDLEKYGLRTPAYEIRLTPRGEKKTPETVLVGKKDGAAFVMEQGTKAVARVRKSFLDALETKTSDYRDRSFSRLGFGDGRVVDVQIPPAPYKLEKAGQTWDVVVGDRRPADGEKVSKLLDLVREWHTEDFRDGMAPEDAGIDGKQFVDIDLGGAGGAASGAHVTLLFGKRQGDKSIYAQRKGDGGVELVDAAPYDAMVNGGPQQFFRGVAIEWPTEFVDHITREAGYGEDGQKIQSFVIDRNLDAADKTWKSSGPGLTGKVDAQMISDLLGAMRSVKSVQWVPYDAKDNDSMGFKPPKGATLTLEVHIGKTIGPETDTHQKLYVGKRRPDGGYFARIAEHGAWAFILPDETVELLKKPLTND